MQEHLMIPLATHARLRHPGAAAGPVQEAPMNCPVPVAAGSEAALSAHGIPKCQALKGAHSAPSQQIFKKEQQAPGEGTHGKTGEEMHGGRNGSDEGDPL